MRWKNAVVLIAATLSMGITGCGSRPDMPVKVITRESLVGEGLVAQFHNELPNRIVVYLVLENKEVGDKKEGWLSLEPNGITEIGWLEGWRFLPGETITISHENYKTRHYRIP